MKQDHPGHNNVPNIISREKYYVQHKLTVLFFPAYTLPSIFCFSYVIFLFVIGIPATQS